MEDNVFLDNFSKPTKEESLKQMSEDFQVPIENLEDLNWIVAQLVAVNRKIKEGWKVQGGISSCFFESKDTFVDLYYQAMIKESE